LLSAVFRKGILKQKGNHISAVSRERGFAEMMIAFYYYIFICRKKSLVLNG
jgi:hypothetical protein